MAETKDKAFEGAEDIKDKAMVEEAKASAELAESGAAGESKSVKKDAPKEEKTEKKAEKKEDKAFANNKIKVGDFVVYEAAHGNRCVQVLDVSDVDVEVVGDEGSRVRISLSKVKKAN